MTSLSIQTRVLLLSGFCMTILIAIVVGVQFTAAERNHRLFVAHTESLLAQLAEQRINTLSQRATEPLHDRFGAAHQTLRGLVVNTLDLRDAGGDSGYYSNLRSVLQSFMHTALTNNNEFLGVFGVWLPDAVDAQDEVFEADAEFGSNEVGRFSSYWVRYGDSAIHNEIRGETALFDTSLDANGVRRNAWFLCSMESGRTCITEPQQKVVGSGEAKGTLVGTVTVPLQVNGKLAGVYGIDIALDFLGDWLREHNDVFYQGSGRLRLVSSGGLLVASSDVKDAAGASVLSDLPKPVITEMQKGERVMIGDPDRDVLWAALPFTLVVDTPPWFVVYQLPRDALMSDAQTLAGELRSSSRWAIAVAVALGMVIALVSLLAIHILVKGEDATASPEQ